MKEFRLQQNDIKICGGMTPNSGKGWTCDEIIQKAKDICVDACDQTYSFFCGDQSPPTGWKQTQKAKTNALIREFCPSQCPSRRETPSTPSTRRETCVAADSLEKCQPCLSSEMCQGSMYCCPCEPPSADRPQ